MMGFENLRKANDTIKLREFSLRGRKEVFLHPYVKALYWHRICTRII